MAVKVELDAYVGATFVSPWFYATHEVLDPAITALELTQGISNGTYSLLPLGSYDFTGQVRNGVNGDVVAEFECIVQSNKLQLKLDAATTAAWPNAKQTLVFDVRRTHTLTQDTEIWISGKLFVQPSITHVAV